MPTTPVTPRYRRLRDRAGHHTDPGPHTFVPWSRRSRRRVRRPGLRRLGGGGETATALGWISNDAEDSGPSTASVSRLESRLDTRRESRTLRTGRQKCLLRSWFTRAQRFGTRTERVEAADQGSHTAPHAAELGARGGHATDTVLSFSCPDFQRCDP
jgi:hypothetical protein